MPENIVSKPPLMAPVIDANGNISRVWGVWFRDIYNRVAYKGGNAIDADMEKSAIESYGNIDSNAGFDLSVSQLISISIAEAVLTDPVVQVQLLKDSDADVLSSVVDRYRKLSAQTFNSDNGYNVNNTQVLGSQGAAVSNASGGATVDAEARTAINTLLSRLRAHGIIDT